MRKEKRTEKIKQKEMLLKFVSTKKWRKWNVLENTVPTHKWISQ